MEDHCHANMPTTWSEPSAAIAPASGSLDGWEAAFQRSGHGRKGVEMLFVNLRAFSGFVAFRLRGPTGPARRIHTRRIVLNLYAQKTVADCWLLSRAFVYASRSVEVDG